MISKIRFCLVAFLLLSAFSLSFHSMNSNNQQNDLLLNVYNEPLVSCGNQNMGQGSWDQEFKCSQRDGGIHQICIQSIAETTNKFSLNTGQTDWSTQRGTDNHCVCLGAWSFYVAKKNRKEIQDSGIKQLKCESIPRIALTKNYVENFAKSSSYQGWQKWNGLELSNQIVDGVNQLFKQCSQNLTPVKLRQLRINYCTFARGIDQIEKSATYLNQCKDF